MLRNGLTSTAATLSIHLLRICPDCDHHGQPDEHFSRLGQEKIDSSSILVLASFIEYTFALLYITFAHRSVTHIASTFGSMVPWERKKECAKAERKPAARQLIGQAEVLSGRDEDLKIKRTLCSDAS